MEGVFKKILSVNLTRGLVGEERLPEEWYRLSLGGLGVGMKYLLEDLKSRKPLLDDPIILMTGPLTGNPLPGSSKACLISYLRDARPLRLSTLEGRFPAYLKLAGFDGLVITGRATEPVSLHISQDHSHIQNISSLWGRSTLTLDEAGEGSGREGSMLAIGPAGENGNPYANLVSDRWVHGGAGMGRDFGLKRLKRILVEPDSDLERTAEGREIPSSMMSYLQKHPKGVPADEIRRSCFGCVKCCGRYDSRDDFLFLEEDIEKLQVLMPQWTEASLRLFYRECLKKGLDPLGTAAPVARANTGENVSKTLERFITQPWNSPEECVDTRSWEEAHLSVQGWYQDEVFEDMQTIPELIERENWAMAKNCLPVCERWEMSPLEMVSFLNEVTGSDYSQQDISGIGGALTREIMTLYRSLGYLGLGPQGLRFCGNRFPAPLRTGVESYLTHRGWEKTGFPASA